MSCAFKILSHVEATSVGQPFTTRECLKYGTRTAVDKVLSRLVQKNVIVRLAYGIFMRMDADSRLPSIAEIAKIKNSAFGKELVEYGGTLAQKFGLSAHGFEAFIFYINGNSTSFRYLLAGVKIVLKCASKKRMQLKETAQGKIIRSLWHLGENICCAKLVKQAVAQCPVADIGEVLALSKAWMPAWLGEYFPTPHVFGRQDAFARDIFYDGNFSPASSQ